MPTTPPLTTGQYTYNPTTGLYTFSTADAGQTVSTTISVNTQNQIVTTELHVIPSTTTTIGSCGYVVPAYAIVPDHGGEQQVTIDTSGGSDTSQSAIFSRDMGVAYYPSGVPLTKVTGTPGVGEYTCTGNDITICDIGGYGQYQFSAADAGQEVVLTYEYLNPDFDSYVTQYNNALDFYSGLEGQSPSAWMESNFPSQAVGYSLTATAEGDNAYLGTTGALPNYTYEVMGFGLVGGGILDASPVTCAELLLTDPIIGVGLPTGCIDAATWTTNASSAANWVAANQFYISEAIQNPQAAAGIIGKWLDAFNLAAVWSEGLIKLIPYGDQATGAYTPNLTIVAALDDDCFLDAKGDDPVKMSRTAWADAFNRVQVNYKNRSNSYNDDLVYEQDEASVERYGLRIKGADSLDFITTWQLASAVANMGLKRLVTVRNSYEFKLPIIYEYLEPMDLISLTDSRLGLSGKVVRIVKIESDPKDGLSIACEDWPGNGYAMPVSNPKAVTPPNYPTQGTGVAGGTASVVVQAANAAATQQGARLYIWCAGADSPTWAGCQVFLSQDGTNYSQIGVVSEPAPIFNLTAPLASITPSPAGALNLTHDTTNTIAVTPATNGNQVVTTAGLTAWNPETDYSIGSQASYNGLPWVCLAANSGQVPTPASAYWQQITSATAAMTAPQAITDTAASQLYNLSAVVAQVPGSAPTAIEFLSFANVAAGSSPNTYSLTDLYRGALGTTPNAFPVGAQIVEFAAASVEWDIPAGIAGQTVYLKFLAWNTGGQTYQTLANAPAVPVVIGALGASSPAGILQLLGGPVASVVTPVGQIAGTAAVSSTTQTPISASTIHDRVSSTISGSTLTGLDNVEDGTTRVGLLKSRSSGNIAYNYRGVYSSASAYLQGDEVVYGESYWLAIAASNNSAPAIGNANWQVIGSYSGFQGAWSSTTAYVPGAEVTNGGNFWVCLVANTNSAPSTTNTNWQIAGPTSLDEIANGLTYGKTLLSALTGGAVNLSLSGVINRTLANIADDSGSSRYAVLTVDSNRRALIDFSQSGHLDKTLDNIADGTSYGRCLLAGLGSGYAIKTGAGAFNIKGVGDSQTLNLDTEIADGATYVRSTIAVRNGGSYAYAGLTPAGVVNLSVPYAMHAAAVQDVISSGGGVNVNPSGGVSGLLPYANHSSILTGVINSSGEMVGATDITATTKTAISLATIHDRVSSTISGYTLAGLDNIADGATYGSIPLSAISGTGISKKINLASGAGITGYLPQANHDPTVLESSVTGVQRNFCPDSDLKFGWTNWTAAGAISIVAGAAPNGAGAFEITGSTGSAQSSPVTLVPGTTYILSAWIDASALTAGNAAVYVVVPDINIYCNLSVSHGTAARRFSISFVGPAGYTSSFAVTAQQNSTPAGTCKISCIQLEAGSAATAYRANVGDDITGYLKAGASQIDFSSSIHLNKTQGNIPDGSGYGSLPLTAIYGSGTSKLVNLNSGVGVYGNLQYTQHGAAVTSGLTTTGNFQSGQLLGGNCGVSAVGSSGLLGLGGTPGWNLSVLGSYTALQGSAPVIVQYDTESGGITSGAKTTGGTISVYDYTHSTSRTIISGANFGISGTPSYGVDNIVGTQRVYGSAPYEYWQDIASGGATCYRQSVSGNLDDWQGAYLGTRQHQGAVGIGGTPASNGDLISIEGASIYDKLADSGSTFGVLPVANMYTGRGTSNKRALIDFSQTHVNATLEYLADAAGSNRYAAVEASADHTVNHVAQGQATSAGSDAVSTSGMAELTGMSVSVTLANAGTVLILFTGFFSGSSSSGYNLAVYVDGTSVYQLDFPGAQAIGTITFGQSLAAGSHTIAIYADCSASYPFTSTMRTMQVMTIN